MTRLPLVFILLAFFWPTAPAADNVVGAPSKAAIDLALRMSVRADLIAALEASSPQDTAKEIESVSRNLILSFASSPEEKELQKEFFEELRREGFWQRAARWVHAIEGAPARLQKTFVERARLKGLGFVSVYFAFKVAGAFVGLYFWRMGRKDVIFWLNMAPWNTIGATIITLPKQLYWWARIAYLRGLRWPFGLSRWWAQSTAYFQDGDIPVPASLFAEKSLLRLPAKGLLRKLQKMMKRDLIEDATLKKIVEDEEFSPQLRALMAWRQGDLSNSQTFENQKSLGPLSVRDHLLKWVVQLYEVSDSRGLFELLADLPESLSSLQKSELLIEFILPFVAREKVELLPFWSFRSLLNAAELLRARLWGRKKNEVIELNWRDFVIHYEPRVFDCEAAAGA